MRTSGISEKFSTIAHIHTITKLIEVSRAAAVPYVHRPEEGIRLVEALLTQDVPTQYTRVLRELCSAFTTKISACYNDVVRHQRRGGVRQGNTMSAKLNLNVGRQQESFEDDDNEERTRF
ncbi:unnamed protein product [Heligmosomoides polygyrus]|uniref:MIF4G_like_2 domain-containing protein n=1 Tax=Heligmosomoides polygyrus TaxID=6339 RepID=A0A183G7Q4_HELPZ|nr:unnamed protein product [Heligmosomoides polygyrus]